MYEKIDPWRRKSTASLRANEEEMVFSDKANNAIRSVVHDSDCEHREQGSSERKCRELVVKVRRGY
jgi:hypothetical protein